MAPVVAATIAALFAAALFAASTALQHRSATDIPKLRTLQRADLSRFVGLTLRHPAWLIGTGADVAGVGAHAFALHSGPLTLVQPLLVTGVVFALPLRQWIDKRRPGMRELGFALLLAAGLATFLIAATPASTVTAAADRLPAVICASVLALLTAGFIWLGRHTGGSRAALSLGVATGLTFAATAALIKTVTQTLTQHPAAVFIAWPFYVLIAVGLLGLFLNQVAFQAGPLRASLPAMVTADPLASLVIGVVIYDETLRTTGWALSGEVIGLAAVVVGAVALSRAQQPGEPADREPPRPGAPPMVRELHGGHMSAS
ncbi:MAG: DMT family transporter [Acidimicrobiaceae bacterium]|nr:DMT family transporter [Acidimicrobiaceae bacterium]